MLNTEILNMQIINIIIIRVLRLIIIIIVSKYLCHCYSNFQFNLLLNLLIFINRIAAMKILNLNFHQNFNRHLLRGVLGHILIKVSGNISLEFLEIEDQKITANRRV